ncbi:hypothetical protein E2C01_083804 [Portunus trituberculatus]|uniref:Uncharacterized protein n=1 Tax=Portunus trituberculatus TaxID=210409 RepID=A0A5B7ITF8_PORTR|nr:hypothetical protein [Portunus trituberculatus]
MLEVVLSQMNVINSSALSVIRAEGPQGLDEQDNTLTEQGHGARISNINQTTLPSTHPSIHASIHPSVQPSIHPLCRSYITE